MPEGAIDGAQKTIGPDHAFAEVLDLRAGVVASETHQRPAIIPAGFDDVDFVAAIRPVLVIPEIAGHGIERQTERVPVSHRIDLRAVTGLAGEWISRRGRAVVLQAKDLAREGWSASCAALPLEAPVVM